jgi:hypothetical protein
MSPFSSEKKSGTGWVDAIDFQKLKTWSYLDSKESKDGRLEIVYLFIGASKNIYPRTIKVIYDF